MAMNPAHSIIKKLGGETTVAAATGTAYTAPYRWQSSVEKGGTGGRIPAKHIPVLLKLASDLSVDIDAADFFVEPCDAASEKDHA